MRGRTIAVHSIVTWKSNQLGEFESGAPASVIGNLPTVASGGVLAVASRFSLDAPVSRSAQPGNVFVTDR
jgi:hypothetical protein